MKIYCRFVILVGFVFSGCSSMSGRSDALIPQVERRSVPFEHAQALLSQGQYDAAFNETKGILQEGSGAPDVALFNLGMISAHSANPKKNYTRALSYFRTVVKEYPQSQISKPAKTWIQVLEEYQKMSEEKRLLIRERESLVQEKEKLKYANDKSRQVDVEIEKRRRETFRK